MMKYILEYNNFINESTMTKTDFIKIAKNKWNNLYLYNHSNFEGMNCPIRIECKKHGPFIVTPVEHLKGKGCPDCTASKSFDKIVHQRGYLPDTVSEPEQGDISDIRPLSGTESKDRESKPYYVNKFKPGRKLVNHKIGGGRSK